MEGVTKDTICINNQGKKEEEKKAVGFKSELKEQSMSKTV